MTIKQRGLLASLDAFLFRCDAALSCGQHVSESFGETVHCADRIIGWHVYRVFVAGGFF